MAKTINLSRPANLRLAGLLTIIAAILWDQVSKLWVLQVFANDPTRHLEMLKAGPIGFDLVLWWNRGISFGLLHLPGDMVPYLLSGSAILVCAFLAVWLWRAQTLWQAVALGLIVGGALGNVIDRLQHGAVVDFLYAYWGKHYWPAFNIGDSCICIGVFMLIFRGGLFGQTVGKAHETA